MNRLNEEYEQIKNIYQSLQKDSKGEEDSNIIKAVSQFSEEINHRLLEIEIETY